MSRAPHAIATAWFFAACACLSPKEDRGHANTAGTKPGASTLGATTARPVPAQCQGCTSVLHPFFGGHCSRYPDRGSPSTATAQSTAAPGEAVACDRAFCPDLPPLDCTGCKLVRGTCQRAEPIHAPGPVTSAIPLPSVEPSTQPWWCERDCCPTEGLVPASAASAGTASCPCGSKACGSCALPTEEIEPAPALPAPRPATTDGDYEGALPTPFGDAHCRLSLRAAVFELACTNPGWQSAAPEYRDGTVLIAGSTVTLTSSRRYWRQGAQARVLDRTPTRLVVTLGAGPAGTTVSGDLGVGPMVLRRR